MTLPLLIYPRLPEVSRLISINANPGFFPSLGGFGVGGGFFPSGTTIFGVFLSSFGGGFLGCSLLCAEAAKASPIRSAAVNNICFNTLITFFFPLSFYFTHRGKMKSASALSLAILMPKTSIRRNIRYFGWKV